LDLAQMHMQGKGTKPNDVEARKWCERAANKGLPVAQRMYGMMLRDAYGAESRQIPKAREWLAKAAAQGDAVAKMELEQTPEPPK
jgi:TPR repeat protein